MLTGRTGIVTGGARGIGRAIVERFAQAGCQVVFCGRDTETIEEAEKEMKQAGLNVHGMVADVREKADIDRLVDTALEKSDDSNISILVNNAGRPGGGPTVNIEDELWDDVIATNLTSVFRVTREVLKRGGMLEAKWGRIVNIASTGGKQGVAFGAPYSASKHGVVGFSKALGLELAKSGVTVNAVCPGFVETDLAVHVREGFSKLWGCDTEEAKSRIEMRIPTGRYVAPREVAELAAYLVIPGNSSTTAQAINVCGGLGNY